jgi:hypothetical protein
LEIGHPRVKLIQPAAYVLEERLKGFNVHVNGDQTMSADSVRDELREHGDGREK